MSATPEELLQLAIDTARDAGATASDAVFVMGRSTSVKVRLGATEEIVQNRDHGLGIRVLVGAGGALRTASTSTSDLTPDAVRNLVREIVAAARLTAPDPFAGLADRDDTPAPGAPSAESLDLWDERVVALGPDEAIGLAIAAERAALDADPRLVNSEGGEMSWGWGRFMLMTSHGVFQDKRSTSISLWTTPVAAQGDEKQRDYWYSSARHMADLLSPETIGREAARRALRRLGARQPKTCQVPVVFEAPTASRLIGTISGAANGGAIYRDSSWLCGRMGDVIASPLVTLEDNPWLPRLGASRLADAEGLATRPFNIVEEGRLSNWVLDTYAGRKLGLPSTRSAWRGVGGAPSPGTSNLWMRPGNERFEDLIASMKEGLIVTDTFGGGANTVNGDYSQGAVGLWVENGEIAYPVNELTIASTLQQLWQQVDAVGNDLDRTKSTSAPSFRIDRMTVAGR
jgi:PmbA protein